MNLNKLKYFLPIRSFIFIAVFLIGSVVVNKSLSEISSWWSIVASIVNILMSFIFLLAIRNKDYSFSKLVNLERGKTKPKQIILMILLILFVGMGGMYLAGFACYGVIPYAAPMMIAPIPLWLAIINFFVLPVSTAIVEDGLYLGCGVNQIKNKYLAILVPAFFFALQHCFIPTILDIRYIVYRFLSFLPLTIILCWRYYKNRNPLPIMIGHAVIDLATVSQILLTSAMPEMYEMMCNL